jgi:hypothetical protein
VLVLSETVLVLVIEMGQAWQNTYSTTIGLTFIAYRSNTSQTHLIHRGLWRDFIGMLVISGCERPNLFRSTLPRVMENVA